MLAPRTLRDVLLLTPLVLGCSTPKIAASDAFAPEVLINSIPQGADIKEGGQVVGKTPLSLPIHRGDAAGELQLELDYANYLPETVKLDTNGLYQSGGGETWVALKSTNMGTDTPDIDSGKPADLDRAGAKVAKAGRYGEALQFFARAISIDHQFPRAHRDMGWCLAKLKRREEAIAELNQYVLLSPDAEDAASVQALLAKARGGQYIDLSNPHSEDNR